MVSPARPVTKGKGGDNDDSRNAGPNFVLSPLSRSLWDSPSRNDAGNRSTPSSRRKLFGFGPENIENEKHSGKTKCKKYHSRSSTVPFSDLFPESSSDKVGSHKSLLLDPKLCCRQNLPPFDGTLPMEGKASCSSSVSGGVPVPKLAPKSPSSKKKHAKSKLSPRNDSMSPLHPPRLDANNDRNYFNDFTLTPTVLYNGQGQGGQNSHHRMLMAPMSCSSQYYHQSPHWHGQVRVNPFSPVPEQYLRPPHTSTQLVSRGDKRKYHPGFYKLNDLDAPTLPIGPRELSLAPRKKACLNPINLTRSAPITTSSDLPLLDGGQDLIDGTSPTDVLQTHDGEFDSKISGSKREAQELMMKPQPQAPEAGAWQCNISNKRVKRGRYLDDFQEVQYLGAGSFGSVNACLSRLDGCMYAVKSISPSGKITKGIDVLGFQGQAAMEGPDFLYGGRKMMGNMRAIPPTPRRDLGLSPLRRKKPMRRFGVTTDESEMADNCYNLGALEGTSHWNEGALRRMLREVFALAALCQQDDVRTFHIVRYQQAWLEDDGTLYIQTELCAATLRDEMSGKAINRNEFLIKSSQTNLSTISWQLIDVFRQIKMLREVLLALQLVHQQGMVHLDIKPENIFVKNNLFKLGDFGLANVFTKNGIRTEAVPDIEEGDSRYMSKDLLDFNPKDLTKCDIFSLGATMYEVVSGHPLPSCGQKWQDLRNGKIPPLPKTTMPCLNAIIKEMMHPDPKKRPSATDLLSRKALACEGNPLFGPTGKGSSYKVDASKVTSSRFVKRSRSWSL